MAIEDLLIPAAIIVLLLAMGGSGEPGPSEEKREELTRAREAWGGAQYAESDYQSTTGFYKGEAFTPTEMESPFDLATTMVLEQTQSREQSILEAVRTMETQLQATQREGLTRERVEGMQTYLETFRQTYVGETGRVFLDQAEDLDQRKRYLEQNLDNDAAALAGDPALDREGKIGVMNQITEQLAQLDASERLVQTVVESVMGMVEEFGVITLRNELARKEAPDTYSEIETFSEESLVPNFKSKTDDESTITLETPAREWKDSAPATSQRLGKILESHASYSHTRPNGK